MIITQEKMGLPSRGKFAPLSNTDLVGYGRNFNQINNDGCELLKIQNFCSFQKCHF